MVWVPVAVRLVANCYTPFTLGPTLPWTQLDCSLRTAARKQVSRRGFACARRHSDVTCCSGIDMMAQYVSSVNRKYMTYVRYASRGGPDKAVTRIYFRGCWGTTSGVVVIFYLWERIHGEIMFANWHTDRHAEEQSNTRRNTPLPYQVWSN